MLVWWLILICALGGGLLVVGGFNREKQPADELLRTYAQELAEAREQARRTTRERE